MSSPNTQSTSSVAIIKRLFASLSLLDKLLTPLIVISMIIGVVIGQYATNAQQALSQGTFEGVAAPLVVGLIVMMWPILTKVPYETLHRSFRTSQLWTQIGVSLLLNWIVAPFLMLGLAWATLPDLLTYRQGVIMVGLARCIAMVMIWNQIARGDVETCAIIVIINSVLQIVLYAPFCVWFINIMSIDPNHRDQGATTQAQLEYGHTAISVLIYLGIPLAAGVLTRFGVIAAFGRRRFEQNFLPFFSPLSLVGLLYTIIIICAKQSEHILDNLGPTFRVFVPYILYFVIIWTATFTLVWRLHKRFGHNNLWTYETAVVQSFTAASNNFELAISIAIAIYGAGSDQALAASIGPLVEVPVLLTLSWVALFLGEKLEWSKNDSRSENVSTIHTDDEEMQTEGSVQEKPPQNLRLCATSC